jgi:hypothetical protein
MRRFRRAGRILRAGIQLLILSVLTACSLFKPEPPRVVLQGNTIQAIYSSVSPGRKELKYYRIGPEALAKLLEKAEACGK